MRESHLTRRAVIAGLAGAGVLGRVPFGLSEASTAPDPIASTQHGKVRGIAAKSVISFRGIIPTAVPPRARIASCRPRHRSLGATYETLKAGPRAVQVGNEGIFASPLIGDYSQWRPRTRWRLPERSIARTA